MEPSEIEEKIKIAITKNDLDSLKALLITSSSKSSAINSTTTSSEDKQTYSVFSYACRFASCDIVKLMLHHEPDFTFKGSNDSLNRLPIHFAFESRDKSKINLFLDLGLEPEDLDRLHLLHDAIYASLDQQTLEKILHLGADVNYNDAEKDTALNCAIMTDNLDMVKFLIEQGADVNQIGSHEASPLGVALVMRNYEIAKILLDNGANVNVGGPSAGYPLNIAISISNNQESSRKTVELLLDHGASVAGLEGYRAPICHAFVGDHEEIVELLLKRGARRDKRLLVAAVLKNNLKMVRVLLEQGLDASSTYNGVPLLTWAVSYKNREMANLLLDYEARIDDEAGLAGKTALHYAAERDDVEMITLLLDRGADVNAEQLFGITALTIAVQRGYNKLSRRLVRRIVLMKSQDLYVSQVNWYASRGCDKLWEFQKRCLNEMELLKQEKLFDDTAELTCFDVLTIVAVKDEQRKLEGLAGDESFVKLFETSEEFKKKFPVYGKMIVELFECKSKKKK